MTIDEAIKILKGEPGPWFILEGKEAWEACQLGIEALKRVEHLRSFWGKDLNLKLPRETKN